MVYVKDTNQPSLPTPVRSVLMSVSVFKALSTVSHSINSPENSPFSRSVLPVLSLQAGSRVECLRNISRLERHDL